MAFKNMGIGKSVETALDLVNRALKVKEELTVVGIREELLGVKENLLHLKTEVLELQEINQNLEQRLKKEDSKSKLRNDFENDQQYGCYLLKEERMTYKPGLYCRVCFEDDGLKMNLLFVGKTGAECKNFFPDKNYVRPQPQSRISKMRLGW